MSDIPIFDISEKCKQCPQLNNASVSVFCDVKFDPNKSGIDRCVLPELEELWKKGIETTCSCCGHGEPDTAWIVVKTNYRQKMIDLGYKERHPKYYDCSCGTFFRAKLRGAV